MIEHRDYTLIIDKSGSMSQRDMPNGQSRWQAAKESTLALARKCELLDDDGLTVYTFASKFRRYERVTSSVVERVFLENEPCGSTNLAGVLDDAFSHYFKSKKRQSDRANNGETILVITDGEPDDRKAVMRSIVDASRKLDRDEELAISFIQVGRDAMATDFLQMLDDRLTSAGAKFDIVDTVKIGDLEDISLTEVLIRAIID